MKLFIAVLMTMWVGGLRVYAQDQNAPIVPSPEKRKFEILVDGQIFHSIEEYKRSRRESVSDPSATLKPKEDRSAEQSYRDFIRRVHDPEHFSFDPAKVRTIEISDQVQDKISRKPLAQDSKMVTPKPVVSMYHLIAAVVMARNIAQAEGAADISGEFHAVSRLFRNVDVGQGVFSALSRFDEETAAASAVTSVVHPDKLEESFENTIRDVEVPLLIISGKDTVRVMALSPEALPGASDEAEDTKE